MTASQFKTLQIINKMKHNLNRSLRFFVFRACITLIIMTTISSCTYVRRAIVHGKPNIDDYKIFANRKIETGTHQPWRLSKEYNRHKLPTTLVKGIEKYKTVAFLVAQNNEIKHESYWDGYNESSLSNSFSMAKSVIALLIGAAIDDGKIKSVDQKVSDFLPQFKDDLGAKLTIRHLLTMSAGLNWEESYAGLNAVTTRAYYGKNLEKIVRKMKVVTEPGVRNYYQSGSTQVLGFILEKVTGKTISAFASEKIWKPIGAKHPALWSLDKKEGHEKTYCCFNSNVRDFARLGQLILQKGKWQGRQIIPEKYITEAITPAKDLKAEEGDGMNNYYGFQFWYMEYKGLKIPYYRGILGQYIFVIPQKNAVVVRLGHERDSEYVDYFAPKDVVVYLEAALEILDEKESPSED